MEEIHVSLKWEKYNGTLLEKSLNIFDRISLSSSSNEKRFLKM
jgi:hypothetical protein